MRFFTAFATLGLIAFAAAQNATTTQTSRSLISAASTSAAASSTASLTAQVRCLQACGSADVCCQAKCVGVPCPSQSQANATNACEAKCPQGNGTASETEEYANCQASCVSSYYMSASATAAPTASGTNSASTTGAFDFGSSSTGDFSFGSATSSGGASATGPAASASTTSDSGNGADSLRVGTVGLGFLGLVMAGMAL